MNQIWTFIKSSIQSIVELFYIPQLIDEIVDQSKAMCTASLSLFHER